MSISIRFSLDKRGNSCHILWCNTMIPWILSFDRITSERITCRKLIQKSFFFLSTLSRIGKKHASKGQQKLLVWFNDKYFLKSINCCRNNCRNSLGLQIKPTEKWKNVHFLTFLVISKFLQILGLQPRISKVFHDH